MRVEAVVLTGGASRRMGSDKAKIEVDGRPMGERIVRALGPYEVTVIGREPIAGAGFIEDQQEFAGPLVALGLLRPKGEFVFVVSCDLPRFDPRVVTVLEREIEDNQAAIPKIADRLQPLCALYRAGGFAVAAEVLREGKRSVMAWIERLDVREVDEKRLTDAGIDPASVLGVNTPSELIEALRSRPTTE